MRLPQLTVQKQANGSQEPPSHSLSAAEKKLRSLKNLRPFGPGFDPRRNRKGRPKTFDQARALAQQIAHETITVVKGKRMTVAEKILREWAESKEPALQKAFIEYCFGKVPDKLEGPPLDSRTTLILHYGHEKEKRDQDYQGLSATVSRCADKDC